MKKKSLGILILEYVSIGLLVGSLEALMLSIAFDSYIDVWVACLLTGICTGLIIAAVTNDNKKRNK